MAGVLAEEGLDSADVLVYITTSAFVIRIRGELVTSRTLLSSSSSPEQLLPQQTNVMSSLVLAQSPSRQLTIGHKQDASPPPARDPEPRRHTLS